MDVFPTDPPTSRPRRRISRALLVVAAIIALVSVVGGGIVVTRDKDNATSERSSASVPSTTTAETSASTPSAAEVRAEVDRVLPELMAFTAERRGLAFKDPIALTVLPPEEFKDKLLESEGPVDTEEVKEAEGVLRALRLLEPGIDLAAAAEDAAADGVVGFYSFETKELYVRGAAVTPFVKKVIVHELTHALQDQHFGLSRPSLEDANDERPDAFQALVEGDATRIENLYLDSLTTADRLSALREEDELTNTDTMDGVPEVLLAVLALPYAAGEPFVRALLDDGGPERLDEAFRTPPTNLEQVLHPGKFLAGESEAKVSSPTADGQAVDEGVLGELALQFVLSQLITEAEAFAASGGWGGDRYVAWKEGERMCLRVRIAMDTRADAGELLAALRKWSDLHGQADVESAQPIVFRACEA